MLIYLGFLVVDDTFGRYAQLFQVTNFPIGIPVGTNIRLRVKDDLDLLAFGQVKEYEFGTGRGLTVFIETDASFHLFKHQLVHGTNNCKMRIDIGRRDMSLYPHCIDAVTGARLGDAIWHNHV